MKYMDENKPTDRMIRVRELLKLMGVSRATLYRMLACGLFPKPQKISIRCIGWRESIVHGWIAHRAATE